MADRIKSDITKNLRCLEDQGFHDWQVKGMPAEHIRDHIEGLVARDVQHTLKALAWLIHDLVLTLHAAPIYDDPQGLCPLGSDGGLLPIRRVGTMTGIVKIDKGARRVAKARGLLEPKQAQLECGRPYGKYLAATPAGVRRAREFAEENVALCGFDGLEDERLVDECLESVRKFAAHFCAALYESMLPVVVLNPPTDLTALWDVPEEMAPLVSAGLSKLADMGVVEKSHNRYRRGLMPVPGGAADLEMRAA